MSFMVQMLIPGSNNTTIPKMVEQLTMPLMHTILTSPRQEDNCELNEAEEKP